MLRNSFWLKVDHAAGTLASFAIKTALRRIGSGSVVYAIGCSISGEMYIGETGNVTQRMRAHRTCLASGHHHNRMMQRAFNAYGADAFSFEILENCDGMTQAHRQARESLYRRLLRPAFNPV
jgi:group I intron endonuclease